MASVLTPPPGASSTDVTDDQRWITLNRQAIAGAFISGLAHELNNPLQVVTGTVELLLARNDLPADVVTRLERIAQQVNKAGATIVDVVGFVRERPTATPSRVDLRLTLDRVLGLRRYAMSRAGITVSADLPAMGTAIAWARPLDVAQAAVNLLMNAEVALAGRSGSELRVSCERAGDRLRVWVQDNGPGVAPEVRDVLFSPFITTRDPEVSAGIGLAAARALAMRNGGAIVLDETASGARFALELPQAD